MIDVSRVINNPRMQTAFTIQRPSYSFANEGEWTAGAPTSLACVGIITPAKADDQTKYLPEGQRQANAITIYSTQDVLMGNGDGRESDVIIWNGNYYRVQFAKPWEQNGYYFAIATGFIYAD
jgi:hypothetical protein